MRLGLWGYNCWSSIWNCSLYCIQHSRISLTVRVFHKELLDFVHLLFEVVKFWYFTNLMIHLSLCQLFIVLLNIHNLFYLFLLTILLQVLLVCRSYIYAVKQTPIISVLTVYADFEPFLCVRFGFFEVRCNYVLV